MSRQTLINDLVDAGYEAGLLSDLNTNELVVLTTNVWTDAARAAAAQMRSSHLVKSRNKPKAKKELSAIRESQKLFRKAGKPLPRGGIIRKRIAEELAKTRGQAKVLRASYGLR